MVHLDLFVFLQIRPFQEQSLRGEKVATTSFSSSLCD